LPHSMAGVRSRAWHGQGPMGLPARRRSRVSPASLRRRATRRRARWCAQHSRTSRMCSAEPQRGAAIWQDWSLGGIHRCQRHPVDEAYEPLARRPRINARSFSRRVQLPLLPPSDFWASVRRVRGSTSSPRQKSHMRSCARCAAQGSPEESDA
jgi:hypothetical protein